MTIRDADNRIDNSVEINLIDCVPMNLPTPGDIELSVTVSSSGFAGYGSAWIHAARFGTFLEQLRELERRRQGSAQVEGMNPAEFRLQIASIDNRGHMSISGVVSKRIYQGASCPFRHAVKFGIEFDPTLLPTVLNGFVRMVDGPAPELNVKEA